MKHKKLEHKKPAPSEQLIEMAVAAFRHHHSRDDLPETTIAELANDSSAELGHIGSRGVMSRQELFYRSEQAHVVLTINPEDAGDLNTLRGQIFLEQTSADSEQKSPEGTVVSLQRLRGDTLMAIADAVGRFRLSNLSSGTYRLDIQSSDVRVRTEEFTI